MFSDKPRCIYEKNSLAEIICQLRFPEILSISTTPPADFQELIRDRFPQYTVRQEMAPPKLSPMPQNTPLAPQTRTPNYQFSSADGVWRINLTSKFISLTCNQYTRWEEFAKQLDRPLAAFIKVYHPAYFERVGLRYLNFISRNDLSLSGTPFSELIEPCYLGPLAEEDVLEQRTSRCSVDAELAIHQDCRVKIHAGPGMVKRNGRPDQELKFIFDQDLFMAKQLPVNLSAAALESLHAQAYSIFRGAITTTLHNAMEPTRP